MPLEAAQGLRQAVRHIHMNDDVRTLMDIVLATHDDRGLSIGASPRAALGLQRAAQAAALVNRNFVTPSDLQRLAVPALHTASPLGAAMSPSILSVE